jgi:vacuolar-type H+-ATPase subunit F/Vma7
VLRVAVIGDRESLPLLRGLGARAVEAVGDDAVIDALRRLAEEGGYALAIVFKHAVEDPDRVKREGRRLGVPVLVLPTPWAPAEPVNVERLLARALGFG